MTIEESIKKDRIAQLLEWAYMIFFALFLVYEVLGTTMFEIDWPTYFYRDIRVLLLVIIFLRYGYTGNYTKKELALIGLLGVIFLLDYNRMGSRSLDDALLLILGVRGISYRKLLLIFLTVTATIVLVTNVCAVFGLVENLIYYQGTRHRRMSMGIVYPTNYAALVFFCIAAYVYLRGEKIKYIELLGLCVVGGVLYWLTDSKASTICIFLLIAILCYHKLRLNDAQKKGSSYQINSVWSTLLALTPVLCAGFMIVSTAFYSADSKFWSSLNKILNSRLSLGHKAFEVYGFSLWGQSIPSTGNGGSTEELTHYFFLDCSYVRILMLYGLLIFICILLICIIITYSARSNRDWILLWVLAVIAVQSMIEHHLMDVAYNPFFWCLLADTTRNWPEQGFLDRIKPRKKVQNEE